MSGKEHYELSQFDKMTWLREQIELFHDKLLS